MHTCLLQVLYRNTFNRIFCSGSSTLKFIFPTIFRVTQVGYSMGTPFKQSMDLVHRGNPWTRGQRNVPAKCTEIAFKNDLLSIRFRKCVRPIEKTLYRSGLVWTVDLTCRCRKLNCILKFVRRGTGAV